MKNYKEDFVSKCGGIEKSGKNQKTKDNIAESLFEIVNGLHGIRDEIHTKWEKEAKRYLKRITKEKNICLSHNTIEIQSSDGQRTIHKITIS